MLRVGRTRGYHHGISRSVFFRLTLGLDCEIVGSSFDSKGLYSTSRTYNHWWEEALKSSPDCQRHISLSNAAQNVKMIFRGSYLGPVIYHGHGISPGSRTRRPNASARGRPRSRPCERRIPGKPCLAASYPCLRLAFCPRVASQITSKTALITSKSDGYVVRFPSRTSSL